MCLGLTIFVACVVIMYAYLRGHDTGYRKRALEDKSAMVATAVARFRAERTAEVYRQRAIMLLHVVGRNKDRA